MSKANVIERENDGVTHINIWSKAKTELGQLLSNFAYTPFHHPEYGDFASMEAFWYWATTGKQHQELRRMYGASAKSYGKKLVRIDMPVGEFHQMILEAIRCKIEQHPKLKEAFTKSVLPFEHYFVYGPKADVVVDQRKKHGWQTDYMETLRDEFRAEAGFTPAAEARLIEPVPVHVPPPTRKPAKDGWVEDTGW